MPTPELQEFFAKIQGGDEGAVEAMLQELDPFLRRVIRLRLLDGRSAPRRGHHGHSPIAAQGFLAPTRGRRARRNELGRVMRLPRCRRAPQGPDEIAQGTPPCG